MGAHPILPIMHVLAAICRPTGRPNSNDLQALLDEGKRMQARSVIHARQIAWMYNEHDDTKFAERSLGRCADVKEGLRFVRFVTEDTLSRCTVHRECDG